MTTPQVAELPEDHLGPVGSAIIGYGVCVAIPLVLFILLLMGWLRERVRAAKARASFNGTVVLEPGETVIHGQAEYAAGADAAVRVEIIQDGTEQKLQKGWKHTWTEVSREVLAQPFYVQVSKDQRVRVEPPDDTMLIDDMDETIFVDSTTRKRAAAISPREEIYVNGELCQAADPEAEGGYRAGGKAWVLRGTSKGNMLISTEPFQARFERQARRFRNGAIVTFLVLAFAQLLCIDYHMLLWRGAIVTGEIVSQRHYTTKGNKGKVTHHYEVKTKLGDGVELKDEVDEEVFQRMTPGTTVAVRRVPGSTVFMRVGPTASLPLWAGILAFVGAAVLCMLLLAFALTSRQWYEKKLVDGGSGQLPEVAPAPPG
ncbi:MAG: hypothetical protein JRI68_36030 [Deltaproteobacteria bacterium]|nr:hypothetical protein [Deltaproteobacteria bacterium]